MNHLMINGSMSPSMNDGIELGEGDEEGAEVRV